jgi:ankyrin repeat protein
MSNLQLIEAVKAEDMAAVKKLLASNADVHQQDDVGWTPLNYASGKGNLEIVKLLLENGADAFKVGRDQRTPYMIALAAGHADVAKLLKEVEEETDIEKSKNSSGREKKYCKAYHLRDFRKFSGWTESKINWKEDKSDTDNNNETKDSDKEFSDDDVVFIHQDFTVTQSMWHNENVIFNDVTPEWEKFCAEVLKFKVPTDLDLIVSSDKTEK